MASEQELRHALKVLIVDRLRLEGLTPEKIADDMPLFGEGLGLDSVDALELVVGIEKAYGIAIKSHEVDKEIFRSVETLARFVHGALSGETINRERKGA
ncbi:MAG: acyl carrier protein [Acidobacteria bacterium]|nr:acyl carrier protein [Acidobacteriota bacterium]